MSLEAQSGILSLVLDPVDASNLYVGTFFDRVFKSSDGGLTWALSGEGLPNSFAADLAIDPSEPATLYVGHLPIASGPPPTVPINGVYKSTDAGTSWVHSSVGMDDGSALGISALAIDPSSPSTLYAADRNGQTMWKSIDGAASWFESATGLPTVLFTSLAIVPGAPSTIYAGSNISFDGGVFKSDNGGASWFSVQGDLPTREISTLVVDSETPQSIWAATRDGLFRSSVSETTWEPFNEGRVHTDVRSLTFQPGAARNIFVGTRGGGVYQRSLADIFSDGFESGDASAWSLSLPE